MGVTLHDHGAVPHVRQKDVGNREVIAQQVAFGETQPGPEHFAQVGETDLLAVNVEGDVVLITGDEYGGHDRSAEASRYRLVESIMAQQS